MIINHVARGFKPLSCRPTATFPPPGPYKFPLSIFDSAVLTKPAPGAACGGIPTGGGIHHEGGTRSGSCGGVDPAGLGRRRRGGGGPAGAHPEARSGGGPGLGRRLHLLDGHGGHRDGQGHPRHRHDRQPQGRRRTAPDHRPRAGARRLQVPHQHARARRPHRRQCGLRRLHHRRARAGRRGHGRPGREPPRALEWNTDAHRGAAARPREGAGRLARDRAAAGGAGR